MHECVLLTYLDSGACRDGSVTELEIFSSMNRLFNVLFEVSGIYL